MKLILINCDKQWFADDLFKGDCDFILGEGLWELKSQNLTRIHPESVYCRLQEYKNVVFMGVEMGFCKVELSTYKSVL